LKEFFNTDGAEEAEKNRRSESKSECGKGSLEFRRLAKGSNVRLADKRAPMLSELLFA
jgi:hypothetical protein